MKPTGAERDLHLDVLKVLGLCCIMLAHSEPPALLMFLRSFDVPLMVIASGAAFYYSSQKSTYQPREYVIRRIRRLITPTWTFLTIFFSATWLLTALMHKPYPFTPERMLFSFGLALKSGIGYVWIIRVFLLVSIIAPLVFLLARRMDERSYLGILACFYAGYEALRLFVPETGVPLLDPLLKSALFYLLPYGCLFGLGFRLPAMKTGSVLAILTVFLLIFAATALYHDAAGLPIVPEDYKYPPGLPFMAYGIFASLLAYAVVLRVPMKGTAVRRVVGFISASSLWVYLWHIFVVYAWKMAAPRLHPAPHFLITFAVFAVVPVTVTYLQKRVVRTVLLDTRLGRKNEELLTALFIR